MQKADKIATEVKRKRVIRVLEFEGPADWIDIVLSNSWLQPKGEPFGPGKTMPDNDTFNLAPNRSARELSRVVEDLPE